VQTIAERSSDGRKLRGVSDESIAARITREVASWPEVTVAPHRFGGVEFRRGRREIGHLHGSRLADLPFPVRVRERLVSEGHAEPHHVLPASGWVSRRIGGDADVAAVIALFRMSYERWEAPSGETPSTAAPAPQQDCGPAFETSTKASVSTRWIEGEPAK
jgi:luciferase-like monooxygenase